MIYYNIQQFLNLDIPPVSPQDPHHFYHSDKTESKTLAHSGTVGGSMHLNKISHIATVNKNNREVAFYDVCLLFTRADCLSLTNFTNNFT